MVNKADILNFFPVYPEIESDTFNQELYEKGRAI